jgi:hypothetical protein
LPQRQALLGSQPVAQTRTQISYSIHASNAGGEIGTQKTRVRRLVGKTPYGAETEVDRTGRKLACFEVTAIAKNHRTVQCGSRLRAVPVNEFVDGMAISALAVTTGQTIKNRGLGELKVGEAQMGSWDLGLCGEGGFCFMSRLHATRPSSRRQLAGMHNWQEFSITLPLNSEAHQLYFGALLVGSSIAYSVKGNWKRRNPTQSERPSREMRTA